MGRGLLSLSKTESYAKMFAKDGMTPKGKTNAIMFRVKADLLKGKTVKSNKPRPMSDELNEVLTKGSISPENIEIFRNGKWQPLQSPTKTNTPKVEGKKNTLPMAEKQAVADKIFNATGKYPKQ